MATVITEECINCGACEPECPNTAIYQGGIEWEHLGAKHPALSNEIFYIVPEKCTECVGFFDHEACAAVCPVDCCVPNPQIPETESVLLQRAKELHPDKTFGDDFPSRFRTGGNGAAPAASPADGAAAAPAASAPATAAPAPAAVLVAAAPARTGKVEKKTAPPLAEPAPRGAPFKGELPVAFDDAFKIVGGVPEAGSSGRLLRVVIALGQPLLGALPASTKHRLEAAVQNPRVFSAAGSTGLNILAHLIVIPLLALGFAVEVRGASLYTFQGWPWFFWAFVLVCLEAVYRLRDAVIFAKPLAEVTWRGAIYGPLLIPFVIPLLKRAEARRKVGTVAFEGYYGGDGAFDEKKERERRYGEIYTFEERPAGYLLRLELPRRIPPSGVKEELGLGDQMPDYALELSLSGGWFRVHGKVVDERLRTVAATAPAFPPDFTTTIPLSEPCAGFAQRYGDKTLEVVLIKASAAHRLPRMADAA